MGKFRVIISETAIAHIAKHKKAGNTSALNKIAVILKELAEHPTYGTGKPEELKYDLKGYWSRRINQKDRMVYSINNHTVTVEVVSAIGHYLDK